MQQFWSICFGGLLLLLGYGTIGAQPTATPFYTEAYHQITAQLDGRVPYDFKQAVWLTENAFLEGTLNPTAWNTQIDALVALAQQFKQNHGQQFQYTASDRDRILTYASVFRVLTDSIPIVWGTDAIPVTTHLPYTYDAQDTWGKQDWSSTFVSKLLQTHKGNCHSLPYLYKIVAEAMGAPVQLALAPHHLYVKLQSKKMGWYNTELSSASFPIDAWLMASGYVHLDAIRSGIYMEALSQKACIALCLLDLVQGYQRKYHRTTDTFIIQCLDKILEHYPHCIRALLLQSDGLKIQYEQSDSDQQKQRFQDYENSIRRIHQLGYRKMPSSMYLQWLLDLKENPTRYRNQKVMFNFNPENQTR